MATELRIRNWDKWQTYRNDRGQPPWIKIYRALMHDPSWVALTDAERGQLVAMWLLAADRRGVIPASPRMLQKICHMDAEPVLEVFIQGGFMEWSQPDATPTPPRRQDDAPEVDVEVEVDTEVEEEVEVEKKDQNLNSARARELRNAEIETNGYVAVSDIPSVGAFLAGINSKVAEREALDFDDISYTLNAFFPPERPGAGTNPTVKAWLGRIPEQTLGSALRYLRVQTYSVDGEEKTWGQLTDEHCKRVITAGLNAILRERG